MDGFSIWLGGWGCWMVLWGLPPLIINSFVNMLWRKVRKACFLAAIWEVYLMLLLVFWDFGYRVRG